MPSCLNTSLTLRQDRKTVQLRFPDQDTNVLFEDKQPRLYAVKLTFLHIAAFSGK